VVDARRGGSHSTHVIDDRKLAGDESMQVFIGDCKELL
jgi:hypothetical protein